MTMRSHLRDLAIRPSLAPLAAAIADNTAQVGQIIDTQGFDSLMWAILTGTLADVDATFTVLIEDGEDSGLSDAAAVADTFLEPLEANASFDFGDDNAVRVIAYTGPKRYARMTITPANNTGAAPLAVVAILGRAHDAPLSVNP